MDTETEQQRHAHAPWVWYSRLNLVVLLVTVTFGFLYYVSAFFVIVPWMSYSVPGITNLGILTFTTAVALYCYVFCVVVDPGRVPMGWTPQEDMDPSFQEVKKKGGAPRYCQKCQQYKPPRSHHCRVCQRCVLRMDHHCPWTNNCIGHANYKVFFLFLIYVNAALLHVVVLLVSHALHALQSSRQHLVIRAGPHAIPVRLNNDSSLNTVWAWALMQVVAFAVAMPLTVGLLMLLAWHVQLLLTNKTTIEHQEGVTAHLRAAVTGEVVEHPYHLGMCNNMYDILGPTPATWLVPNCGPAPGGTSYLRTWDVQTPLFDF